MRKITKDQFAENIKEHEFEMYRVAYAILKTDVDAQDAVGETIVKVFERMDTLRDIERFKPWAMKILVNEAKKMLRTRRRFVSLNDEKILEMLSQQQSSPLSDIWESVLELEDEFRVAATLYYYDDFSMKEISDIMDIPEGTVKSRLSRAREKLRLSM